MGILVLGLALIIAGSLAINFVELSKSLKLHDQIQWQALGSPQGTSFADLGKSIGVMSWVLAHGYEHSPSQEVRALGAADLAKAQMAKYSLLIGALCLPVGFILALFG